MSTTLTVSIYMVTLFILSSVYKIVSTFFRFGTKSHSFVLKACTQLAFRTGYKSVLLLMRRDKYNAYCTYIHFIRGVRKWPVAEQAFPTLSIVLYFNDDKQTIRPYPISTLSIYIKWFILCKPVLNMNIANVLFILR